MKKRIKLFIDATIDRNRRVWFLFDSEKCRIVSDLSYLIAKRFGLMHEHIILEMDNHVLLPMEKIDIIRDNDSLTVSTSVHAAGLTKTKTNQTVNCNTNTAAIINTNGALSEKEISSLSSESSSSENSSVDDSDNVDHSKQVVSNPVILKPKKVAIKQTKTGCNAIRNPKTTRGNTGKTSKLYLQKRDQASSRIVETTKSKTGSGIHIRFNDTDSSENDNEITLPEQSIVVVQEMDTTCSGHFVPLDLAGCIQPKIGDRLKYKLLELSPDYTPTFSPHKEGSVLSINVSSQTITLQLTEETISLETKRIAAQSGGKFSLSEDAEETVDSFVEIGLSEMIEPMIFMKD